MTKAGIGVLVGVVIGAGVGGIGGTIASVAVSTQKRIEVRRGWNSTPVLIAKRELGEGAVLTMDDVEVHSVAEALVTKSHVNVRDAHVLMGQRLRVPMRAGQLLEWSFVPMTNLDEMEPREACVTAITAKRGGSR